MKINFCAPLWATTAPKETPSYVYPHPDTDEIHVEWKQWGERLRDGPHKFWEERFELDSHTKQHCNTASSQQGNISVTLVQNVLLASDKK